METKQTQISQDFVEITQDLEKYFRLIKSKFDGFDATNSSDSDRNKFVESEKEKVFNKLDFYFDKIWQFVKDLTKENYILYQKYFQRIIAPLFEEPSAVNKQIYRKPLGYPGDYIVMNYIYDYYGNDKYLGERSLDKLINNYTCNVPFSKSNIVRKEFFKNKIEEIVNKCNGARILSVGSGPARELFELIEEGKINKKLTFTCLDLEQRVLEFVKEKFEKLEHKNKELIEITYLHRNILELIKNKGLGDALINQDLVYASGLFDYLRERFASRLIKELFNLLKKNSSLFICNASAENYSHRAYYEFLGDWVMIYRTKQELISWTKDLANTAEVKFENQSNSTNYLFLNIKKV
jgi:SAM-dependent methyltransferase